MNNKIFVLQRRIKLHTVDAGSGKRMSAHTLSCYCYSFWRQLDTFLVPGWPQIVQYAKNTYGDDGLRYVFNTADVRSTPIIKFQVIWFFY